MCHVSIINSQRLIKFLAQGYGKNGESHSQKGCLYFSLVVLLLLFTLGRYRQSRLQLLRPQIRLAAAERNLHFTGSIVLQLRQFEGEPRSEQNEKIPVSCQCSLPPDSLAR